MFTVCLAVFVICTLVCTICGYPMGQEYFGIFGIAFVISGIVSLHESISTEKEMKKIQKERKTSRIIDITKPKNKQ